MMRYQPGVGPNENGGGEIGDGKTITSFEGTRFRSPSKSHDQNFSQFEGDVLLQWGHKKRSRCWRTESKVTDESSSSSSTQFHAMKRVHRRVEKNNLTAMKPPPPPPPPPPAAVSMAIGKTGNLKPPCSKDATATAFLSNRRNLEERSGGGNGCPSVGKGRSAATCSRSKVGKRSPVDHRKNNGSGVSVRDDKLTNGCSLNMVQQAGVVMNDGINSSATPHVGEEGGVDHDHTSAKTATIAGGEKLNGGGEANEWPRISIPLSRKEKEEDFLIMKGTKLPHRPKKRPKAVDRLLQYCVPGMWLADVSRARYEVKEKKCAKKQKRRGLKGMESMDSDSDQ